MAYKKNYRKRTTRTVARKGKCTYTDIAMKAWQGVKALKGIINSELKLTEIIAQNNFVTTTGSTTLVSGIGQGDLSTQRNGNSVLAKMLYIKYYVTMHASTQGSLVKAYLIKDNQQIADTNPSFTDVFTSSDVQSFPKWDSRKRFQIKDVHSFREDENVIVQMREFSVPIESHLIFNGTASTDTQKGHYYILLVSNQTANVPQVSISTRLTFYDN